MDVGGDILYFVFKNNSNSVIKLLDGLAMTENEILFHLRPPDPNEFDKSNVILLQLLINSGLLIITIGNEGFIGVSIITYSLLFIVFHKLHGINDPEIHSALIVLVNVIFIIIPGIILIDG